MLYTNLKSHPNKFLENHLKNVGELSYDFFNSLKISNANLFSEISFYIGLSHDFAKSTSFFQKYLIDKRKTKKARHSFLSAFFTYYTINNFIEKNNVDFHLNLDIIAFIVVLSHHGNLKNIPKLSSDIKLSLSDGLIKNQIDDMLNNKDNLICFYKQYNIDLMYFLENFDSISKKLIRKLSHYGRNNDMNDYFYIILFYSILLDADKFDASETKIISRENIPFNIVDKFKEKNINSSKSTINKIREEAYNEVNNNIENIDLNDRIFSINLPTGIGKTLTGFSAVTKLKNNIINNLNFNPRIIYSLPFLTVIDQNETVIKNIFNDYNLKGSNFLLKHNYLSDMSYELKIGDDFENLDFSNSKILVEGWNSEVIVTTFIQFFYSIITNKNKSIRKFHNIVNSIIILDEIQAIPYEFWNIINLFLKKLAYEYNCWIILMTATQPLIFENNEIKSLVNDTGYYFNKFDRINYNFNINPYLFENFCKDLVDVINNSSKDIMIVLNTIDSSKELYFFIKKFLDNKYDFKLDENGIFSSDNIQLIYLSTNIIPKHRLKKINSIQNTKKQNIIITTQLIEAGVDIDVDIIYRDFAPLDSIIQTAGRCNRNGYQDKGQVNIIYLVKDNGKPYANSVYDVFLLEKTKDVLKDYSIISEKNFNLHASKKYFNLISQIGTSDYELMSIIQKLYFEEIPHKFKLIKNSFEKIDVFVCIDEKSTKIFNQYKYIKENLQGFKRKEAFLKIKSDFYQYVISVNINKLGSTNIFNDEIGVVYQNELNRKYNLDMGFINGEDEPPMIW